MEKNGFSDPSKYLTKEELILVEEEKLRKKEYDGSQLETIKKSKQNRLHKLQNQRVISNEDKREISRLEHDLIEIENKMKEIGFND